MTNTTGGRRALAGSPDVREAIRLLHATVAEDRRQIILRIGFAVALVAFTFRDLQLNSPGTPLAVACLVGASLACLLVAAAIYFRYYHKTIDVMYELALRSAYADPGYEDLDLPRAHWIRRRGRWWTGSVVFFVGCAIYAVALLLSLFA